MRSNYQTPLGTAVISDYVRHEDGSEEWTETISHEGAETTRKVTTSAPSVVYRDCYCCSCEIESSWDPFCRNHGLAKRACETHGTSATFCEESNEWPTETIQQMRAKAEAREKAEA